MSSLTKLSTLEPLSLKTWQTRLMMKPETVQQLPPFWQELFMNKDTKKLKLAWILLISNEELIWQLNKFAINSNPDLLRLEEKKLFLTLQLFQLTETEKLVICLPIFTRKLVFMEPSLSRKERHFTMKSNSLTDWSSIEDTFLLTSLQMRRNKKLSSRTAMYLSLRRNSEILEKFCLSLKSLIKNKNHFWSLLKTSKANYLLA